MYHTKQYLRKGLWKFFYTSLFLLCVISGVSQGPRNISRPRYQPHESTKGNNLPEAEHKQEYKSSEGAIQGPTHTKEGEKHLKEVYYYPVELGARDYEGKTLTQVLDLKECRDEFILKFTDADGHASITYSKATNEFFIDESERLAIKATPEMKIDDIFRFQKKKVKSSDVHFASILDDAKSDLPNHMQLSKSANENRTNYNVLTRDRMRDLFNKASNGILLISGHYEKGSLFARTNDGKPIADRNFSEQELKELGKEFNVDIVFLGCETASIASGTGYVKPVYDVDVMGVMTKVMQSLHAQSTISNAELYGLMTVEGNKTIISSFDPNKNDEKQMIKVSYEPIPKQTQPAQTDQDQGKTESGNDFADIIFSLLFFSAVLFIVGSVIRIGKAIYNYIKRIKK